MRKHRSPIATSMQSDIMLDMAKKHANTGRPPTGRKPADTLFARVDPEIGKAFRDYIAGMRPRVDISAMLTVLIEDFLRSQDRWPPPSPTDD